MQTSSKKHLRRLVICFAPFLVFIFFILIIGGALSGGLSNEIASNQSLITELISHEIRAPGRLLTAENVTGHTFVSGIKISHQGAFKAKNLFLAANVSKTTTVTFYLVQNKKETDTDYTFSELEGKVVFTANGSKTYCTAVFACNQDLTESNFIAMLATDSDNRTVPWEIMTLAFIS